MPKTGFLFLLAFLLLLSFETRAATPPINFSINLSEAVAVTGSPRIAVDVDGATRYATYSSGSGTSTLVFSYSPTTGDVDLNGIALSSPIDLNGGTIKDLSGNDATLTYTVPDTSGVKVVYPSLSMDFITDNDGRFTLNGTAYNDVSSFLSAAGGTFSRASTATYFDSSGTLQTAGTNTPRFDYDPSTLSPRGLLIERASQNYIPNSQFSGLSVGTSTSTNKWAFNYGVIPGTVISVTGTGTNNGIPYVDVRYNIPTNSTGSTQWPGFGMYFADAFNVINGDKTIVSSWFGVTSYTATGGTCTVGYSNRSYTSGGAYITEASNYYTATAPYIYRTSPVITHGATAGKSYFMIYIATPANVACDITIRLGAPQIEFGSTATSYIPTTGTTAARQADAFTVPTGSWYNASEGTMVAEAYNGTNAATVGIIAIDNSASPGLDRLTLIRTATTAIEAMSRVGNVAQFQYGMVSGGNNTLNKVAMGYKTDNFRQSLNGAISPLDTSGTVPSADTLRLGCWSGTPRYYDGWIQKFSYFPLRTSDTQLQLLTQ